MAAMARYQIRVEVQPRYLPEQSDPEQDLYTFAYTITVTNTGEVPSQLISREWVITDAAGGIEEVKGLGVVGQQPLLRPGETYQYTSGCRLRTPNGSMEGGYFFVAEDGERFEVEIPPFQLSDGRARVLH
jgi:ApaG protein